MNKPQSSRDGRSRVVLALLAGLLTTAAFPPFDFWLGAVLGPAFLLFSLEDVRPRRAALLGWLYGFAHFITGVWWVLISTHVYGGAPLWLALLLLSALAAYLGLFMGLASYAYARIALPNRIGPLALLWPACWLLGEFARDTVFDGFPWFSLGYVGTEIPGLLNVSALIGVHGLTALLVAFSGLLVSSVRGPQRLWAGALIIVLAAGVSKAPAPSHWTTAVDEPLDAVLVQGNVPQDEKWQRTNLMPTVNLYQSLTEQAFPADLVIWPEVAIPAALWRVQWFFDDMDALARAHDATLLAGVITLQDDKAYNTVYALGAGSGRYVKQHLVPFGEYIPAPDWVRPVFDVLGMPFPSISKGLQGDATLQVRGHVMAMSICFEDVFPLEIRQTARNSAFLVNVTNDAWFSGSAAPQQHLQIARLRAAESGRSLLRVANTGISAVIGPDGEVQQTLGWAQRGLLRTSVQPRTGQTPYHRFGRAPLYLFVFGVLLAALIWRRRLLP